ncbi:MAG: dynamin family protein [Hyphomicrobiales bacterium]|nr:dynamin family protein [Hyphomicrobiales bacterium]
MMNDFSRSMITQSIRTEQSADQKAKAPLPRVVIAGETNSGKTSLVNFLLGGNLLPTDIVANTRRPTYLRHGQTLSVKLNRSDGASAFIEQSDWRRLNWKNISSVEVHAPSAILEQFEILDLPGFFSQADSENNKLWLRPSDLLIWCSPATQAWKASEQAIWKGINHPRSCAFLAITHRDLLSTKELNHVTERIAQEAPRFFMNWSAIAAPQAVSAQQPNTPRETREMPNSTGIDDFMRKLINLLQSVKGQASATPKAKQKASDAELASLHPLQAFAQLREQVEHELRIAASPTDTARILSSKLSNYNNNVLREWMLSTGRTLSQSKRIESLISTREEELNKYFIDAPNLTPAFTPSQILQQLGGELSEIIISIENKVFAD